jgi:hypothetical protein
MKGSQTLLRACNDGGKLPGTMIKFSKVDYGFKWVNSFGYRYASASVGGKVGIVIGMVVLPYVLGPIPACPCNM